jgi:hypothetical protein
LLTHISKWWQRFSRKPNYIGHCWLEEAFLIHVTGMITVHIGVSRTIILQPVGIAFPGFFIPLIVLSDSLVEDAVFAAGYNND